jgi:MFS transporter, FSR family, fosmidomycin resistance protein
LRTATTLRHDVKVIGLIGSAHFLSHFFQLIIPPLFVFMKDDFGVSYAQLGLVLALMYTVSGVCQVLAGFAVDRFGARRVLLFGMAMMSSGIALTGLSSSYPMLFIGAFCAGLGNSVFHPADFSVLNARVERTRLGHAYSTHSIGGNLGWAAAPVWSMALASLLSWNYALILGGVLGLVATAILAVQAEIHTAPVRKGGGAHSAPQSNLALFTQAPILMCFGYFTLFALCIVGTQTFSVPALQALYGVPRALATAALTVFLLGGAGGILAGGFVATRTDAHARVAAAGMFCAALFAFWIAAGGVASAFVALPMALMGFCLGMTGPSRDMLVRANTPAGATGRVYGFVYSGLDAGAIIGPVAFGWYIDHGAPRMVFVSVALCMLLTIVTVASLPRRQARVLSA